MDENWRQTRELFDTCIGMGRAERDARLAEAPDEVRAEVLALLSVADRENSRRHRYSPLTVLDTSGDSLRFRGRDEVTGEAITMELFRVREDAADAIAGLLIDQLEQQTSANGNQEWLDAGVGPNHTAWIVTKAAQEHPLRSWLSAATAAIREGVESARS